MQDQDQRKYFSHATLTFVFTIASPNSRSSLIQLEVNKTQALYFCLSINRFGKPVSTLGASSAKTRFCPRACFSGSCSRPTKACDENLVDGLGARWLRRKERADRQRRGDAISPRCPGVRSPAREPCPFAPDRSRAGCRVHPPILRWRISQGVPAGAHPAPGCSR